MNATTWRKRAACTGIDSDIFYPASEDEADAAEAKAICAVCPVQSACLEHALPRRSARGSGAARPSASGAGSTASAARRPEPARGGRFACASR